MAQFPSKHLELKSFHQNPTLIYDLHVCEYLKIIYVNRLLRKEYKGDLRSNETEAVVKIRPEINSGLYGIWTHYLDETGAVLYQLSTQAKWKLIIMLICYKPLKWWIDDCEYWKPFMWAED